MTLVGKLTLCLLCVTLACAGAALPFRDSSHGSNGNPTSQVVADPDYLWIYDAENRLTGVSGAAAATFVYDGDGNRVKATFGSTTTIYVGNTYERDNGSTVRKYYYAGGVRIAMRSGGQTYYLLGDHLGGTNVTANGTNGAELGRVLYRPWGETRLSSGSTPTTWRFTGQREDATIGLYFYNARYLDPQLGRFISADSVVQGNAREPGVVLPLVVSYANPRVLAQMNDFQRGVGQAFAAFDPQLLNRYAYARNNPLAYRDDSGHVVWWVVGGIVGGVVGFCAYALTHQDNFNWKEAALWTGGGTVVGATFGAGAQFVAGALGTQAAVAAGTSAATTTVAASRGLNAFSRAGEFGIRSFNQLRTMTRGTGLHAHHLIEERFAKGLGLNAGKIPSVALTPQEHQAFINAWRNAIGYDNMKSVLTTSSATLDDVWRAAQSVYRQYPELLDAVRQLLGK